MSIEFVVEDTRAFVSKNLIRIDFPYKIWSVAVVADVLIVHVKPPSGSGADATRNIYGISADGAHVWQVPKFRLNGVYMGIGIEDGLLRAYHWSGTDVWIDPRTGEILRDRLAK